MPTTGENEREKDNRGYYSVFLDIEKESSLSYSPSYEYYQQSFNTDKDYNNCTYRLYLYSDYGEKIQTELGTFTLATKTTTQYQYTCPVNPTDITSKNGKYELIFTATNSETNELETLCAELYFYKLGFKGNANLKVEDTDLIKDGKVLKDYYQVKNFCSVAYNEVDNELRLLSYEGNITYSNMGSSFNIVDVNEDSNYFIACEDTETGIKLDTKNSNLPKTVELVVDKVTNGKIYSTVSTTLNNDVTKLYVYDISLESDGVEIQPNGKVKISIPVPNDIYNSKLVIYRITENGEKIEYTATIETIDNIKYATFETDHFSTYVLAEKSAETKQENFGSNDKNSNTNKGDNTTAIGRLPNTGVGIIITLVLVVSSIITLVAYMKYRTYKDIK